jgi:hypothetical protein
LPWEVQIPKTKKTGPVLGPQVPKPFILAACFKHCKELAHAFPFFTDIVDAEKEKKIIPRQNQSRARVLLRHWVETLHVDPVRDPLYARAAENGAASGAIRHPLTRGDNRNVGVSENQQLIGNVCRGEATGVRRELWTRRATSLELAAPSGVMTTSGKSPLVVKAPDQWFAQRLQGLDRGGRNETADPMQVDNIRFAHNRVC